VKENLGKELTEYGAMVTDCEDAFRNSIKKNFPDMPLFRCWNHLWGNIERFVKGKGGNEIDVTFYTDSIRSILLQPSETLAKKQIDRSKTGYVTKNGNQVPGWTNKFSEYFEKSILPDIKSLASYEIMKYVPSHFNEFTGLTTNHCEGLNNLLKVFYKN
jgi:transposase-like protein